jgi:superfamily II DNA or RNA helicase
MSRFFKKKSSSSIAPLSAAPTLIFSPTGDYLESVRSVSYLGKKGYTIPKSILLEQDYEFLKKELYMKPMVMGKEQLDGAFAVYRENDAKMYLPRFYGISRYGLPPRSEIQTGEDCDIEFVGELRDYQQKIVKTYVDHVSRPICAGSDDGKEAAFGFDKSAAFGKETAFGKSAAFGGGGILEVPCGRGKCLGKDTPVLMYDGTIRLVQDIMVGDLLMGDDSTPRTVLTLARGRETMYRINEMNNNMNTGNTSATHYTVNQSHILSLKTPTDKIIDISVLDYLSQKENLFGYRIPNTKWPLKYSITIQKLGMDDYYGFEIDGNRRFVLGDFTVTHNTVMGLKIITELAASSGCNAKKTIILVHKEFLMNQWIERIADFLPSARVGKIQANKLEIEGNDIVIGMIKTLFTRDFPTGTFDSFGLTIIDEVHHIGSEMFSRCLLKIVTPYILGISATVERKDKLTKVLYMYIGPKIYSEERSAEDAVTVHGIYYKTAQMDDEFNETEYDFKGQPKYSTMITKLCNYGPRSDFIVRVLGDTLAAYCSGDQSSGLNGQVMILSHNRSLLTYLYNAITHRELASVGFYVGGMKERDLKETEEKQVVLATYSMAAEALDIKTLSILIMATPKKDIEQSVGRILRVKHKNPIVIDIVDPHSLFQNQWATRKRFYKKCNYNIVSIDSTKYKGMSLEADGLNNCWKRVFSAIKNDCVENVRSLEDEDDEDMAVKKDRIQFLLAKSMNK